ncbi:MAG: FG-GAP-like repeat-containing protein [Bacteroidia bacterium]
MKKLILFIGIIPFVMKGQGGWTKITSTLNPVTTFTAPGIYKGAAWVDINNDGNTDLFAMPNFMFLNTGGGNFTQLSNLNINPVPTQNPGGCSWADINNDGNIDFITAQNPSEIYLNNGNNTFQNFSANIPALSGYAAWGCALADVNNDNRLDLLYAQAYGFHGSATPTPCNFFIQDVASFSFSQKKGYAFTDSLKPYTVPYFHDYDMDGDMDLFIATGPGGSPGPDYCYRNMKKETGLDTLYKMTVEPWSTQLQDGQCYNAIDFDNDGDLDLCLTNYSGASSRFYINSNGIYTGITMPFTNTASHLSNAWGDFDNDGDLDVIMAFDNSISKYYRNNGNGSFTQLTSTFAAPTLNSCIISCDYDNDGDLDVFVDGNDNAKAIYKNDTVAGSRKWINYTFKGTVSNRSAIGAIIKVKAIINGMPVWQIRTITAQNSFQGQNDLRQHVGLGDASQVDSVLIYWPSGLKEFYINKPINQFETFIEGNGTPLSIKQTINNVSFKIYPNPSNGIFYVETTAFQKDISIGIEDIQGRMILESKLAQSKTIFRMDTSEGFYFIKIYDKMLGLLSVKKIYITK